MPRIDTAKDPFALPGRVLNDGQTSCKPAGRVLISNPEILAALGAGGVWDEERRCVDYEREAGVGTRPIADVETTLLALVRAVQRLEHERATQTLLLKAIMHGAIAQGLRLSAAKGKRQLYMSGGVAIMFDRDATGGYAVNKYTIPVLSPLRFYVAAGANLIDQKLHDTLPGVCAGDEDGEPIDWPAGSYRADCLALIPKGEDPIPEWYLFLGRPTSVNHSEDATGIPTPHIPSEHSGDVLPLYRIVTRQGAKGIHSIEQIANRVNGI